MPDAPPELIHKAGRQSAEDPFRFIMSTASTDRMGDVIEQDGWDLRPFKQNPIALFQHNADKPIGVWEDVRVEAGKLTGRLKLAARGTSQFLDELHALIEQRILKAVSVGFRPLKHEPLEKGGGYRFLKQELMECSLVSIPANSEALSIAKSMEVRDLVFFGGQSSAAEETPTDKEGGRAVSGATTLSETVLRANRAVIGARRALK